MVGGEKPWHLTVLYRPPPSASNGLKDKDFPDEIEEFLGDLVQLSGPFVLMGDFNIHYDTPDDPRCAHFMDILRNWRIIFNKHQVPSANLSSSVIGKRYHKEA